jgi:DNA-binding Xre family transcriptional regulator
MKDIKIPIRYLPYSLDEKDKKKQKNMILKSRKLYKQHKYYTRKQLPSFKSKKSSHITNAKTIYNVDSVQPNKKLARATGCSMDTLNKIVNKGKGAYFSSGSRPNQTAQSWGIARLASSLTSGKAAAVDFSIIEKGCDHNKKAYRLALKSVKKNKHGQAKTRKVQIN